ncbi:MAG: hypothetical protein H0T46_11055 [Deltaproteobacteria bacterium]|nr:hypothetical protein [Deltaproteobacteria bacterium]
MTRFAVLALALSACASEGPPPGDVTDPYVGPITRYVVDRFDLPTTSTKARELGDDLDGDQTRDNQLGLTFTTLSSFGNLTTHAPDMIASGALASIVQIQADERSGSPARVWFYGAEGDEAVAVGGRIADGKFTSNRTRSTWVPGTARLRLPVFVDSDPVEIELHGVQIDLTPDGKGGYDGVINGGVREADALRIAYDGIMEMLYANPQDHRTFWYIVDRNHDGTIGFEETTTGGALLESLIASDLEIRLRDGTREPMVSLGFGFHISPCPSGQCAPATIADRCHDRILDGTETDIDCGGDCMPCGDRERCSAPEDCFSGSCAGGQCAAASCSDGRLDGFEADIDCGGGCGSCASGRTCDFAHDCTSGMCTNDRCF